jgi:hypothetical protein
LAYTESRDHVRQIRFGASNQQDRGAVLLSVAGKVWQNRTMPGGSDYAGPLEALQLYRAVIEASGNGEVKGAKNPYTSRNGHMLSFLDGEGTMALHLSKELENEFRSRYRSGPVVSYGRTMRGYSSVPPELLDDIEALREWYDRAWEWIGTLKPKPTKKVAGKATKKA